MTIGEILAGVRREQGKSIADVEKSTKIRGRYIELIENNQLDALPGSAYATAFIKSYAIYLGLDHEPFLKQYDLEWGQAERAAQKAQTKGRKPFKLKVEKKVRARPGRLRRYLAGGAVAVFAVLVVIWFLGVRLGPTVEESSSRADNSAGDSPTITAGPPGGFTTSTMSTTSTSTAPLSLAIKIKAQDESWVLVKVDDNQVFQGVMEPGETREWKGDETVFIWAGRGEVIDVLRDGMPLGKLAERPGITKQLFTLQGVEDQTDVSTAE